MPENAVEPIPDPASPRAPRRRTVADGLVLAIAVLFGVAVTFVATNPDRFWEWSDRWKARRAASAYVRTRGLKFGPLIRTESFGPGSKSYHFHYRSGDTLVVHEGKVDRHDPPPPPPEDSKAPETSAFEPPVSRARRPNRRRG